MARQEELLQTIVSQAKGSALYQGVPSVIGLDGLSALPLTHYSSISDALSRVGQDSVLASKPDFIFETSGSTGDVKRIPLSLADVERIADDYALCMHMIGLRPSDHGWNVGGAYPLVSGEVMERTIAKIPLDRSLATLLRRDTDLVTALEKASRAERIDVVATATLLYFVMARTCRDPSYLEEIVGGRLVRDYRVPGFLSKVAARAYLRNVDHRRLTRLLSATRIGLSYAEPLTAYRDEITSMFPAIRMVDMYGSTENPIMAAQLDPSSDGLCLIVDSFVAEIARPQEVNASKADRSVKVEGVPWWHWKKGMRGELLLSRMGDCLPLLRYPTGDVIEVVDPDHPAKVCVGDGTAIVRLPLIKVLGRSVDVLDFEVQDESGHFLGNKVYSRHINDALQGAENVRWWELYVVKGTPGRMVFVVIPDRAPSDVGSFHRVLLRRLVHECEDPLHTFRTGETLGRFEMVVAPPEAYRSIQAEIDRRARQGRSVGQLKPKRIHTVTEDGLQAILAARRGLV